MLKGSGIRLGAALLALLFLTAGNSVVHATSVDVQVLGPDGEPVSEVAVFVVAPAAAARMSAVATATMDQIDTCFVPHMLVVQKGTAVEFPNSDVVAHHVYSFSKPNNFVLPLYKGDAHAPITFEHAGVVILGCNIHDGMLGYIVVVDSGVFGITDVAGRVTLELEAGAGDYLVNIWSPRIRDDQESLQKTVSRQSDATLVFGLQKKLRPPHDAQSTAVKWSEY
ncbi:MAG: methylamine utilization protein [Proteobacteria bacterium]|nr:methylamine utilization protein [Pseudomonadota bacterium]